MARPDTDERIDTTEDAAAEGQTPEGDGVSEHDQCYWRACRLGLAAPAMSRITSVIDAYDIGAHDQRFRFRCRFRNRLGLERYPPKSTIRTGVHTPTRTPLRFRKL